MRSSRAAAMSIRDRMPNLLPRPVRRATRQATRHAIALLDGRASAPKRSGLMLSVAVLGSFTFYGAVISGKGGSWLDASAATLGTAIVDLRIEGALETNEAAIAEAVGIGRTRSVAAVQPADARAALVALPWVSDARVTKQYPGTISVSLEEREAVALWRLGSRTLLIDADGTPIVDADARSLPLLVGEGAETAVASGLDIFSAVPEVTPSIKALVRVASRRWDVVTHRNVVVMLPADQPKAALERLAELQRTQGVLDKEIVALDFRVPDRVAIRLTSAAAEQRAERVEEIIEERRKSRKDREVEL